MAKSRPNKARIDELQGQVLDLTQKLEAYKANRASHWPSRTPEFRTLGGFSSKADTQGGSVPVQPGVNPDDDAFRPYYAQKAGGLVEPLVPFEWLWNVYTQCDVLNVCVRSTVDNICNPGTFTFPGSQTERESKQRQDELTELQDFFSQVGDRMSFLRLRKKMERSIRINNVWFVQVIRDAQRLLKSPNGNVRKVAAPNRMYYIPAYQMRASVQDDALIPVPVRLKRQGKLIEMDIPRKFRKFARIIQASQALEWFKEMGDPRIMDRANGEYYRHPTRPRTNERGQTEQDFLYVWDGIHSDANGRAFNEATEIWWHRGEGYDDSNNLYGLPAWFSCFWDVKGRQEAKWVNFDHLDKGGIPPGMLAISGGQISPASKQALDNFLIDWRTPSSYAKVPYLEVTPEANFDINANDSGSKSVRIEWIKLRDPQHEDYMFEKYLESTEEAIGAVFRLPPVLRGKTNTETYASAATAIEITESQVFQPARLDFDEKVTIELLQNEFGIYGWKFVTAQSKIGDKETFYKAIGALNRASALSINDTRDLANKLLGTELKPFVGTVYDEPVTLVKSLADQGMLTMEGESDQGTLKFIGAIAAQIAALPGDTGAQKADFDQDALDRTNKLVEALHGVASLKYEAPTSEQIATELLPEKVEEVA